MFKNNKYTKTYNAIIHRAKNRHMPVCYTEVHHVIPRCMGGDNSSGNLVVLEGREHYICHLLLPRMVDDPIHVSKLMSAAFFMSNLSNADQRPFKVNNRIYQSLKEWFARETSKRMTKYPPINERERGLCPECGIDPVSINYYRTDMDGNEKVYYKKKCATCIRKDKKKKYPKPSVVANYRKKPHCEKCGFHPKFEAQLVIHHIDLDQTNYAWNNLKTVCLNCEYELVIGKVKWSQGDLVPDNINTM